MAGIPFSAAYFSNIQTNSEQALKGLLGAWIADDRDCVTMSPTPTYGGCQPPGLLIPQASQSMSPLGPEVAVILSVKYHIRRHINWQYFTALTSCAVGATVAP